MEPDDDIIVSQNWLNMLEYLERKEAPADVIRRFNGETWLVPDGAITLEKPMKWIMIRQGDHVHIPLVPYIMSNEPENGLAFMLSQGIRAGASLPEGIRRVHLSIGVPTEPLEGSLLRYHIGFAVLLAKE